MPYIELRFKCSLDARYKQTHSFTYSVFIQLALQTEKPKLQSLFCNFYFNWQVLEKPFSECSRGFSFFRNHQTYTMRVLCMQYTVHKNVCKYNPAVFHVLALWYTKRNVLKFCSMPKPCRNLVQITFLTVTNRFSGFLSGFFFLI